MSYYSKEDFDKLIICEKIRKSCELAYAQDPLDAHNLIKWGGALLELSEFHTDKIDIFCDAILKFEDALAISPSKHYILWCLGNAYSLFGANCNIHEAQPYFDKASGYFRSALDEDPDNEIYQKSLLEALKNFEQKSSIGELASDLFGCAFVAVGIVLSIRALESKMGWA